MINHLSNEQQEALARCARGISLRFEDSEIVEALVSSGYARINIARVVTVTPEGMRYLRRELPDDRERSDPMTGPEGLLAGEEREASSAALRRPERNPILVPATLPCA